MAAPDRARLDGKVAVVTGAAQGIGRGIATSLAEGGARVVIGDLQDAGNTVAAIRDAGGEAADTVMDISVPEQAAGLINFARKTFGGVDVLVNNAGIDAPDGNAWDLPLHEWRRTIDVNLTGTFLCSQAAIPAIVERGGGSIVSISSHSSRLGSPGMSPAYKAGKAGTIGMSAALAIQLGGRGIRSNAVCPGAVRSRHFGWTREEDAARTRLYTLGMGEPEDIGGVVRFLASPLARWVTGSAFYVHSGFLKEESLA